MKKLSCLLALLLVARTVVGKATEQEGRVLYETRCAICHGLDAPGTGPLAHKSTPPANDFTSAAFQKRLAENPGVIVSSVVLIPNGTLIPETLKKNGERVS
ncbi:MAG: cytochrome c [Chthoniobacterales bacterium]|nr:cytochrome c [Chthoniobacterales bacterium]